MSKHAEEKRREENREAWLETEDDKVQELAADSLPLNVRLAAGIAVFPHEMLRYIAALERRVDKLEKDGSA